MYTSEALNDSHRLTTFDCGKPELNLWLSESARHASIMGTCKTTVWHDGDDVVLAYYGLAAHVIERASLSSSLRTGSPAQIPSILLARLARDKTLQGQGLGSVLLADCFRKIHTVSESMGVRFVVVDAIDESAAAFYRANGFKNTPVPFRLVRKMSSIIADLT